MKREEFIRLSALFGIGIPLGSMLQACEEDPGIIVPDFSTNYQGKILIVGAGAAGMAAAYLLERYGVDYELIEAQDRIGGRMKRLDGFADFPIDLGAEWIHTHPRVLSTILKDPSVNASVDFVTYNPQTAQIWDGSSLSTQNSARNFYSEWKFKSTTWFGFFEEYLLPSFQSKLRLNTPIDTVDYSGNGVVLTTNDGSTISGDKVLLTVPVTILQNESISFSPDLPNSHREAYNKISMGDGLKIFVEFSERFYPDILLFGGLISALATDSKAIYDAAFRKNSSRNILGLFCINEEAAVYTSLGSDEAIIEYYLNELDTIFDGKASRYYLNHEIQNWSADPYVQGSYSYNFDGDQTEIVNALKAPISNKLYFAGEALNVNNQAMVHGAAESGYEAVAQMIGS